MNNSFDIDSEIENDFKKNSKISFKSLILVFLCIALLFVFLKFHSHNTLSWYTSMEKKIEYVESNWEKIYFSDLKVVKIPQKVYDSVWKNPKWSEYLFWEKKRILFIYWDWCPYARAYDSEIERAFFSDKSLWDNYLKEIVKVPQLRTLECTTQYCPEIWIEHFCGGNLCIINPVSKEIIVDNSHDEKQISSLLKLYADRSNKELF